MTKRVCLIVPAYNEEAMMATLYQEITSVINPLTSYEFILLVVDDGSSDNTLKLVKEIAKKDQRVKYLSFSRNYGKEASMLAGLEAAHNLDVDAAMFMDADLQDPPGLIVDFLKYYEEGYKYIFTRNKTRKGQAFIKKMFSYAFYKVYRMFTGDSKAVSGARDFALLDRDVIVAFLSYKDKARYSKGISSQIGFKRKYIEYDYHERALGKTKWSFKKLFRYAMMGIEQFSRIYELVPTIISWLLFGGLVAQIVTSIMFDYPDKWLYVVLTGGFFLMAVILTFIMKVVYDIRDQELDRPLYIIEERNL